MHASEREVFLTLTHRMYLSETPDGTTMLDHVARLHLVLGGGVSGNECGDATNNRLFASMDQTLWQLMIDAWNDELRVTDGGAAGDTFWAHTNDLAGPHEPFDASAETQAGLHCLVLVELPSSLPPTAQAHYFQAGSAARVDRGPGIQLPADPFLLEIDHDFDCFHQSNPICGDFLDRYVSHYGDYEADWRPTGC
jgi:hypothetical protein